MIAPLLALQRLCPDADLVFACARREALAVLLLSAVSGLRERRLRLAQAGRRGGAEGDGPLPVKSLSMVKRSAPSSSARVWATVRVWPWAE